MNRSPLLPLVPGLFALALLWLAGCSSTPMSRIDANRALYESWPIDMQSAILDGKAVKDMTPEMVRMALGEPTRIEPKVGSTTGEETWFYAKDSGSGNSGGSRSPVSLGGGMGGLGGSGRRGGGGGSRNTTPAAQLEVVFQNGVVTNVI